MPIRIETCVWGDDRFALLAKRANLADVDHAIGKMARLWQKCTMEGRYTLTEEEIELVLGPNGVEALIASRLGERTRARNQQPQIRIKGTKGRIEWLEKARKNGKKGGRPKKTRSKPSGFQNENLLDPAPDLVPDPAPSQISDPPRVAEPARVIPLHQPPLFQDERQKRRQEILSAIVPLHVEAYNRLRSELQKQVPPMGFGDPAERMLRQLLLDMPVLDNAEEECRHVLAIGEAEARQSRELRFFGASLWHPDSFRVARNKDLRDVGRDRKPAKRSRSSGIDALIEQSARSLGDRNGR